MGHDVLRGRHFVNPTGLYFVNLSISFIHDLARSTSLRLFRTRHRLPRGPILRFVLTGLKRSLQGRCRSLFPAPRGASDIRALTALVTHVARVLRRPDTTTACCLGNRLYRLFSFLSSKFCIAPIRLDDDPRDLLFLHVDHLLRSASKQLPHDRLTQLLGCGNDCLGSVIRHHANLYLFSCNVAFYFRGTRQLLQRAALSIDRVTLRLGFAGHARFCRLFQRGCNVAPRR